MNLFGIAQKPRRILIVLVLLLLFTAFLRIRHLVDFVEWPDEIYTVWQAKMNIRDGLIHTDPFWPPLFGTLVWTWMHVVSQSLEAIRFLSVLFSLLATASIYQASRTFFALVGRNVAGSYAAGVIAALAFATMGYTVFAGVDVRGYGLLLFLLPLTLWLILRWFAKPDWRRGVTVAIALAVLLYASFSSLILIPFLTLLVLLVRPRLFLSWVGIGVMVLVLVLPIVPQFVQNNVLGRLGALPAPMPVFFQAIAGMFGDFGGVTWFLALVGVAFVILAIFALRYPMERRSALFLMLWLLFPVMMYFALHNKDMWRTRYLWWVAPGLALAFGYAFARLPRVAVIAVTVVLILLPAAPTDFFTYRLAETTSPPFRMVFSWLTQHILPGDVLVIDPRCTCGKDTGWDYFVPQYFTMGHLPIVSKPGTASRVWYLSNDGWGRDKALYADIENGRTPSMFVGPWYFLLRLYEGPPSMDGVTFGGKIGFHGVELEDSTPVVSDNQTIHVKLWWSVRQKLDRDYSISLALLDSKGAIVAQVDGAPKAPAETPGQTSVWEPGTYYQDVRSLYLPAGLEPGDYRLVLAVYQWWDGVRLPPEKNSLWPQVGSDNNYLLVQTLKVGSPW